MTREKLPSNINEHSSLRLKLSHLVGKILAIYYLRMNDETCYIGCQRKVNMGDVFFSNVATFISHMNHQKEHFIVQMY